MDKDRKEELWNVGFACGELIPDGYDAVSDTYSEVYYVAGYKNDHHATAMLDPQLVRASYISDGIGCNIVLVSIDCIGISKTDLDRIKDDLKGFVRDNNIDAIHIASTHTHAGIDTLGLWGPIGIDGKNSAFMEKIAEVTKETIVRSCENIRQGRMYFGYADTGKIQRDSRYPEIYDKNIYRIRFAPEDGSKGLEIISYDAHAESLRSENTKVSADYPCYMGRKIKDETGNEFMFFAGAVGGLIMTHVLKDERGLEYPYETNVIKTGEYLADCVLSIDNERELYPDLSTDTEVFDVPLDNQLFATMSFLGVLSAKAVRGEGRYSLALRTEASLLNLGGEEGINIA
ncbi:MAG: hypothetical protein GX633_04395, partial [Clostridiales bacterium]|nr:hypothetical protein [Clostridiales bacterium]